VNRFIPNLPAAKYHADDIGETVPSLSSSIASVMIEKSPWHAHRLHPKLGGKVRVSTDSMDAGQLMHALLLGQEGLFDALEVDDFRTKAAQVARKASVDAGRIPVKKCDLGPTMERAARIDNALRREHGIELGRMRRELTTIWSEKTDILGQVPADVVCRARLDAFDGRTIYDIKTCADASRAKLARSVTKFGYHVQGATYTRAVEHVDVRLAGRVNFVLIFIENETLAVDTLELDSTFLEFGRQRWQEAVNAWHMCLSAGKWPGYSDGTVGVLECPEWYRMTNDTELHNLRRKVTFHV
jgi:hypothetical protein